MKDEGREREGAQTFYGEGFLWANAWEEREDDVRRIGWCDPSVRHRDVFHPYDDAAMALYLLFFLCAEGGVYGMGWNNGAGVMWCIEPDIVCYPEIA